MKLCFVCHVMFYKYEGNYFCTPGFVKMLEVVAPLYEKLFLCVPVKHCQPPQNLGRLRVSNIEISPLPVYYYKYEFLILRHPFKLMSKLWQYIKKADVVWVHVPAHVSVLVWIICLLQRKKHCLVIVGDWANLWRLAFKRLHIPVMGTMMYWTHKVLLRLMSMSALVTLAQSDMSWIFGRNNPKIAKFIDSSFVDSDILSEPAGSNSEKPRLIYSGRLLYHKGIEDMFDAVKLLLEKGLDFELIMAGDGGRREEMKQYAKKLNIDKNVTFMGWVAIEDLFALYHNCDFLVLPSHSEGGPKVVTEAMAKGLPIVATNVGFVSVVVENGVSGFIVPIGDVQALSEAIKKLLTDRQLRRKMGQASLERAHLFTMEAERLCIKEVFSRCGLLEDK